MILFYRKKNFKKNKYFKNFIHTNSGHCCCCKENCAACRPLFLTFYTTSSYF